MAGGPAPARSRLPRSDLSDWQLTVRYHLARIVVGVLVRAVLRVRIAGAERIPAAPALYCFNHMGWVDPLVLLAACPGRVRLYFYGPREATMSRGLRNRLMWWVGIAVRFTPGKDDLRESVRRVEAVFDTGASLAIAAEGAIHVHEGDLLPLSEGAAYLALRARVPIVPVALSGTSQLGFGRTIHVRIGAPIETGPRPTHDAVNAFTWRTWYALRALVARDRDLPPAGPFGRWLTDLFNDWGPGGRVAAAAVRGPDPADVPYGPDGSARAPEAKAG